MLLRKKTILSGLELISLALFVCLFSGCKQSITLQGKVIDSATQSGISSATVQLYKGTSKLKQVTTDSLGSYKGTASVDKGAYSVKASALNYQPQSTNLTVTSTKNYTLNFSLTAQTSGNDTTPPTGTISINNAANYSSSLNVTLALSAIDSGSGMGSGSQMQFSNNNSTWSAAENYAVTKSWALTTGDGQKTVYVKFKDVSGNWSQSYSDTIILDTTLPQLVITSPQDNQIVTKQRSGTTP